MNIGIVLHVFVMILHIDVEIGMDIEIDNDINISIDMTTDFELLLINICGILCAALILLNMGKIDNYKQI